MQFKVGDRVRHTMYDYGLGEVTHIYNTGFILSILWNCGLRTCSILDLELVESPTPCPVARKFKVGDIVTFVHHKITVKGTIKECHHNTYGGETVYQVHKDALFDFIVLEEALTLIQAAQSTDDQDLVPFHGLSHCIPANPWEEGHVKGSLFVDEILAAHERVKKMGEVASEYAQPTCDHTWTTYQGLFESFEHCSKCGEKKK